MIFEEIIAIKKEELNVEVEVRIYCPQELPQSDISFRSKSFKWLVEIRETS